MIKTHAEKMLEEAKKRREENPKRKESSKAEKQILAEAKAIANNKIETTKLMMDNRAYEKMILTKKEEMLKSNENQDTIWEEQRYEAVNLAQKESKTEYEARKRQERRNELNRKAELISDLERKDPDFADIFYRIAEKRLDGIDRYGLTSFYDLGIKGIFVDINRKHIRLKRHFWKNKVIGSEKIEDSMLDNIVYIMLLFKAHAKEIEDLLDKAMDEDMLKE